MSRFALFTDSSVDPKTRVGVGAYLRLPATCLDGEVDDIERADFVGSIRFKPFTNTSSTQLELETALWAIGEAMGELSLDERGGLTLYTDSQGVEGLLRRRDRLEANLFLSKKTKQELNHSALYRHFYQLHDKLEFGVIKVKGHQPKTEHDTIHRLFSFVDQEVRKKLSESRTENL